MKLNVLAFGLACGLIWGLGVFLLPWWVMAFEAHTHDLLFLATFTAASTFRRWAACSDSSTEPATASSPARSWPGFTTVLRSAPAAVRKSPKSRGES